MFIGITLLFLDFTGTLHPWLAWTARLQFWPAMLSQSIVFFVAWIVITLIFGRIYCSIICPLGIFQDIVARRGRIFSRRPLSSVKGRGYSYSKPKYILRLVIFLVFIMLFTRTSYHIVTTLLEPYSIFGRMMSTIISPIYRFGNNILAWFAAQFDSYMFYTKEVWQESLVALAISAATILFISILAWRNGRTYCNTICPIGTLLNFFSRYSLFKVRIDADKCRTCQQCVRNCKASCIDLTSKTVDYRRCVVCGDCLEQCKFGALKYAPSLLSGLKHKPVNQETPENPAIPDSQERPDNPENPATQVNAEHVDTSRRAFLLGAALATTGAALAETKKKVDGGLAEIKEKANVERQHRINPPGSLSLENMSKQCTGCQLCVQACPSGVLRPSTALDTFMQPELDYRKGHCQLECTACSEVCPAEAILPLTKEKKASLKIGTAQWVKKNCIVLTDHVECGNCARHCPAGAIEMMPLDADDEQSPKVPVIHAEYCIGCGACEHLCPARPFTAIKVEGVDVQHEI